MKRASLIIVFLLGYKISATNQSDYVYVFSHGLAGSHKQAYRYVERPEKNKPYILKQPLITFDFPDVSTGIFKVNRLQTSLAQENEIHCLASVFSTIDQEQKVILAGVSRGASTIVNFTALYQPSNLCALILESPFDCVDNVITGMCHNSKLGWIPGIHQIGLNLMSFIFCKYNPKGIKPIDIVAQIPLDLPILIICAVTDTLVPVWSSMNLYLKLQETGHVNTHLLILPQGKHAYLILDEQSGFIYQSTTHAFYKKFNLPHDQDLAQAGIDYLQYCQPDSQALSSYYPLIVSNEGKHGKRSNNNNTNIKRSSRKVCSRA